MTKLKLFETPDADYKLVAQDSGEQVFGLQVFFDDVEKQREELFYLFWNGVKVGKVEIHSEKAKHDLDKIAKGGRPRIAEGYE